MKNSQKWLIILFLAICDHFSSFAPAYGQPLDPTSVFIDNNIITRSVAMITAERKLLQAVTTPFSHYLIKN